MVASSKGVYVHRKLRSKCIIFLKVEGNFYGFKGGDSHRSTSTWSKVFCKAKNAPNSFSVGASPQTPPGILRSLDCLTGWSVKYPHYYFIRRCNLPLEKFSVASVSKDAVIRRWRQCSTWLSLTWEGFKSTLRGVERGGNIGGDVWGEACVVCPRGDWRPWRQVFKYYSDGRLLAHQ